MKITVIDNVELFKKIKAEWEVVYSSDPNATVFSSWGWMHGWIESTIYNWSIIAIKPNDTSPYVAFMPVCINSIRKNRFNLTHNLFMAGYPSSDQTGFLCLPEFSDEAIPAFARFIQKQLKFDTFYMRNVFDPRVDLFLKCFSSKRYNVQEMNTTSCPYIMLPDNWDKYLKGFISSNTRANLKYYTKKIETLIKFHVTYVRAENLEAQIATLLMLWQSRWGLNTEGVFMGFKTKDILDSKRSIFRRCFQNNSLWLTILWDGNMPVAGMAAFLDYKNKTFINYNPAFDKRFEKLSPGKVMVGYSIRYAIENGFQIYDFGAGDEEYKFSFGVKERFNKNIIIRNKTFLMRLKDRMPVKLKILKKTLLSRTSKETNSSISQGFFILFLCVLRGLSS